MALEKWFLSSAKAGDEVAHGLAFGEHGPRVTLARKSRVVQRMG
jgi:hypothetical protein